MQRSTPSLRLGAALALLGGLGALGAGCGHGAAVAAPRVPALVDLVPTHGVAIGDVTSTSAVVWSRASRPSRMTVRLSGGGRTFVAEADALASHDQAAQVVVEGLEPGTAYDVEAWFTDPLEGPTPVRRVADGGFRTAPRPDVAAPVHVAFGGDLAGQNLCRDEAEGFPIFDSLAQVDVDLFVALGDMIYADGTCHRRGRFGELQVEGETHEAHERADYWARWRYVRGDDGFRRMLARSVYVATWDDHEFVNNFDPRNDASRLAPARSAFFDWNPVRRIAEDPSRVYRSVRWGRNLELFVLDTRQHRDPGGRPDEEGKTMLGAEQSRWLKEALVASDARWKVVVSSVTLAVPSGSVRARDGWTSTGGHGGFETELRAVLREVADRGVRDLVVLSADVHFAAVFEHRPFAEVGDFVVTELVGGPLHARPFPEPAFDDSLGSIRRYYHAPTAADDVDDLHALKRFLHVGELRIDADGRLVYGFRDAFGRTVHRGTLLPR